ncbi:tigger transposable element-derived protein 1-like [Macrobrachium rosenbergii]|uniref:tigger transposable element-derived protein 1-like n=1 Tax=Macrobrachium rosenbergii TaxID=79674 RepID=UPI0034D48523
MSPKCPAPSKASGKEPKHTRKVVMLQEKVGLLDMLNEGKSYTAVAWLYDVIERTVRYIKKKEVEIKKAMSVSFFFFWIMDYCKKNIPLNTNIICEKARQLYQQFSTIMEGSNMQEADFLGFDEPAKEEEEEAGPSSAPEGFRTSKGWFQLKSVALHGEVALADMEVAVKYPKTFKKIIRDEGYYPEHVFIMDETGLFWKKMPSQTYLMKMKPEPRGSRRRRIGLPSSCVRMWLASC